MNAQPSAPGSIPLVKSGDHRWDHLPFLKTWLIWIGISTLITTGLIMLSTAILPVTGLDVDENGDPSSVSAGLSTVVCLVISGGISFLTFRWSLQRFLLPKA